MAIQKNNDGFDFAMELIDSGNIDTDSAWSFTADDGNAILGEDDDWGKFADFHLARQTDEESETKAGWAFPHSKLKDGTPTIYEAAIDAIKSRAGQFNHDTIQAAAQDLSDALDEKLGRSGREIPEFRSGVLEDVECRETDDGKEIHGIIPYGKWSGDLGGFREKLEKGAFTDTIEEDDIRALWNHDSNFPLGRKSAGTLELEETKEGLRFKITPPDTMLADSFLTSIERGDAKQNSFQFLVEDDDWNQKDDALDERTVKKAKLREVSVGVVFPAYKESFSEVRKDILSMDAQGSTREAQGSDSLNREKLKLLELIGD